MNLFILAQDTPVSDPWMIWALAPVGALVALAMAYAFSRNVMAQSEGDADMIEIAEHVRAGAMAYLVRQYKVVFVVFLVLIGVLSALGFAGIQPIWSAVGVPIAGLFSGLCGWFGMKMATNASARTTNAVRTSLNDGLKVAFRSGAVMGLIVVGFALLDTSVWFYLWNKVMPDKELVEITSIMLTFGMGASTQALFARVGGGVYTKAADVGADLVVRLKPVFQKMTQETQQRLQITLATTLVTLLAWVLTSTKVTTVQFSQRWHWVLQPRWQLALMKQELDLPLLRWPLQVSEFSVPS